MGRNKDLQRKITGIRRKIEEHEDKISRERQKANPDEGDIIHWEHEIDAHETRLQALTRRLRRKW